MWNFKFSHFAGEPEKDANSLPLYLPFSSNHSQHNKSKNRKIKAIQDTNSEHEISLYADDLLLYWQEPQNSLRETFNNINTFSGISNSTINWNNSMILPFSEDAWASTVQNLLLHTGNINYSDRHISPGCQSFSTSNIYYPPKITRRRFHSLEQSPTFSHQQLQ